MKRCLALIKLSCVVLTVLLLTSMGLVFAQQPSPTGGGSSAQAQESAGGAAGKLYEDFLAKRQTEPDAAYQLAKEIVEKYPNFDTTIVPYLKDKWIPAYLKSVELGKKDNLRKLFADKKYQEAFTLGKEIIASEPDDLSTLLSLSYIGVNLSQSGNNSFNTEAMGYSKKALEAVEAGKVPENVTGFNKDQVVGQLNIALGRFSLKANAFEDAVKYFMRAVEKDMASRQDPATYFFIGQAYVGLYEPVAEKLKVFVGQPETDESRVLQSRLDQISDVMIDTFARTVAYSGTDPKHAQVKNIANEQLTVLYKARHEEKTDGLSELIASVTSKPLPVLPPPAPPSATPTPPSNTTPTTGTGQPAETGTTPKTPSPPSPTTTQLQPTSRHVNEAAKPNGFDYKDAGW